MLEEVKNNLGSAWKYLYRALESDGDLWGNIVGDILVSFVSCFPFCKMEETLFSFGFFLSCLSNCRVSSIQPVGWTLPREPFCLAVQLPISDTVQEGTEQNPKCDCFSFQRCNSQFVLMC